MYLVNDSKCHYTVYMYFNVQQYTLCIPNPYKYIAVLLFIIVIVCVSTCIRGHLVLVRAKQSLLIKRQILQQSLVMLLVVKKLS